MRPALRREVAGEAGRDIQHRHPQPEQLQRLHGRGHAGDGVRDGRGGLHPLQEEEGDGYAVPLHGRAGGRGEHVRRTRQPEVPISQHTVSRNGIDVESEC